MQTNDKKRIISLNQYNTKSATLNSEKLKNIPEEIFINQKKKIQELKYYSEKSPTFEINEDDLDQNQVQNDFSNKNEKLGFSFNGKYKWDRADFEVDYLDGDEIPFISSDWTSLNNKDNNQDTNSIELRNTIIKSCKRFNFQSSGLELNANVTMKGESSIWIFSRAPEQSVKNKSNVFNKNTSVIKISKEDKCQRCFISFGIFVDHVEDNNIKENGSENGHSRNFQFKTFSKRQLVNFSIDKNKNRYYYENDICDLKVLLIDSADEKITVKVYSKKNF